MTLTLKSCFHCVFFQRPVGVDMWVRGLCQRHAPILDMRSPHRDQWTSEWPPVKPDDGCGDFVPRGTS